MIWAGADQSAAMGKALLARLAQQSAELIGGQIAACPQTFIALPFGQSRPRIAPEIAVKAISAIAKRRQAPLHFASFFKVKA